MDYYLEILSERRSHRRFPAFSLIVFLLVFSILDVLCNHLLDTTRVYAQCDATTTLTSYIPITYTVTVTQPGQTSTVTIETTSTSTSTLTSTVQLSQASDQVSPASISSGKATYSFVVESGSTSWYGATPSSGLALSTMTTTIYIVPGGAVTVTPTTTVDTVTIQPPPYVSTSYSMVEATSTSTITQTRTITTVVTNTISRTRTAFTSPGSWNSTTMPEVAPDSTSIEQGVPTTITGTVYFSLGPQSTSTMLTTLTLTLTRSRTATLTTTPEVTITEPAPSVAGTESAVTSSEAATTLVTETSSSAAQSTSSVVVIPASYGGSSSVTAATETTSVMTSSLGAPAPFSQTSEAATTSPPVASSSSMTTAQSLTASTTTSPLSSLAPPAPFSPLPDTILVSTPATSTTAASIASLSGVSSGNGNSLSRPSQSSGALFSNSSSGPPVISLAPSSLSPGLSSAVPSSLAAYTTIGSISTQLNTTQTAPSVAVSPASALSSTSPPYPTTSASAPVQSMSAIQSSSQLPESTTSPATRSSSAPSTTLAATAISPTPSVCGEHGNFTLNFDDLPSFTPNKTIDITQAPPIFNGYHHLAFSNGYVYAPPPQGPFPPVSPPHLAVFLGNASGNGTDNTPGAMAPISGMIRPGEFGDGISDSVSAFWFDGYSAWLGCDNPGPESCVYVLSAYAWNPTTLKEEQIDTQNATTAGCPGFENCHLEQIAFPSTFRSLSGLQIQAYRGPDQVMFFMDDVNLGWSNNTCAAGLQRLRSQRGGTPLRR